MIDSKQALGLFASLKQLCATAVEIGRVRLELVGTELELEKKRLFEGLLWALAALMALGVGLVLLCGFIILLFWEGYRLPAVGVLTVVFLLGAGALMAQARKRIASPAGIFGASLGELNKDLQALKPKA